MTGDITGGLASASAPWLAGVIKEQTLVKDENGNTIPVDKLSETDKQNISALAQLAAGLAVAAGTGGDIADTGTAVAGGKNAVENNWAGMVGIDSNSSTATGADSILHANTLTQEEAIQALNNLIKGEGMPNGSDYVELWMRAPEQVGQLLPGPLGTAMALLAATDIVLTGTDKADLVSVLNKATNDYLSGIVDSESMLALNGMVNKLTGGNSANFYPNYIKDKVETNVNNSQKGNESSNFGEHTAKDNAPTVKDTTDGTLIFHENMGGHTIAKHVGKSDAQLLARLESEKRLSAASLFSDDYTANKAIGDAIQANESQINNWLKNNDSRLVLQHDSNFVVGKVIQKGQTQSDISKSTIIVIERDPLSPSGYRIQTAYPK